MSLDPVVVASINSFPRARMPARRGAPCRPVAAGIMPLMSAEMKTPQAGCGVFASWRPGFSGRKPPTGVRLTYGCSLKKHSVA
jgi:hypothetical protein